MLAFLSLRTKRCSRSLHLTVGRTKSVVECGNFRRRSLAFSSVRALCGLPPGHLLTVPVSRDFLNSLLTPRFLQFFSGNSSVNLFAVYPFKYKLFIKMLSSSLNIMLIVDKHCAVMRLRWRISDATNWSPKLQSYSQLKGGNFLRHSVHAMSFRCLLISVWQWLSRKYYVAVDTTWTVTKCSRWQRSCTVVKIKIAWTKLEMTLLGWKRWWRNHIW